MRLASYALLLVFMVLVATGCDRADKEQCERLCWRYNELHYWDAFEKETADMEPEAKKALRAERQAKWDEMRKREFDPGLDNCLKDCRRSASPDDVECVEKAQSAAAAKKCLK